MTRRFFWIIFYSNFVNLFYLASGLTIYQMGPNISSSPEFFDCSTLTLLNKQKYA